MKYPKCNSELPDKAKFCPECGSNISAISAISSVENKADAELHGCYHLLHWIEYSLQTAKCRLTWKAARRILSAHCYSTVIIQTTDGKVRHLRKPGRPDEQQRAIYANLGIDCSGLPIWNVIFKKM